MDANGDDKEDGALRLIRGKRKKLVLGLAGTALLIAGFFAAPRSNEGNPPAVVPQEPAAPLFQGVAQREAFRGLRLLQESGRSAVRHTASLVVPAPPPAPDRSHGEFAASSPFSVALPAVVVRPATLLANLRLLGSPSPLVLSISATAAEAVLERCDPETGLALFRVASGAELAPAAWRTEVFAVGDTGVGVARVAGVLTFDPVVVAGADEGRLRLAFARLPPGAPVFDGEGRLAAVAGPENGGWTIEAALRRLDGLKRPIPTILGLSFQTITDDLAPSLVGPGIAITDVEAGGAAESAGVQPGDVLVRIGEHVVSTAAELDTVLASLSPREDVRLTIRREKREIGPVLTPRAACTTPAPRTHPIEGPRADSVFSADALARAGVPPETAVLSIDGAAPRESRVAGRRPRLVRFQVRGQPPFFILVRP